MFDTIISIDCDFDNYYPFQQKIKFNEKVFFRTALKMVNSLDKSNTLPLLMIHTSPFIRNNYGDLFYKSSKYLDLWKNLTAKNYEFGLHPHEEDADGKCYYYYYSEYMSGIISSHKKIFTDMNIEISSIRLGYFTFNEWLIPILEKENILFSLDNMGGFIKETSNHFEDAPLHHYYYSYKDKDVPGSSKIMSIPLGMTEKKRLWKGLVPEANSFEDMKILIDDLYSRSKDRYIIVYLLIHLYAFAKKEKKILKVIDYLKKYSNITSIKKMKYSEK